MADGHEPELIDVASVAAPSLHDVNESAIAASGEAAPASPAAPVAGAPPNAAGRVDRRGRPFDAALHDVDVNGLAVLRRDGRLQIRQAARGRSAAASFIPPPEPPAPPVDATQPPDGQVVNPAQVSPPPRVVARAWVVLAWALARISFGREWKSTAEERDKYTDTVEVIIQHRHIAGAAPPELALIGLMAESFNERAEKPDSVTARWWQSCKETVLGWCGFARPAQPEPGAAATATPDDRVATEAPEQ